MANEDPEENKVVFQVCNRAKSKGPLKRTSYIRAEIVQEVGADGAMQWMTDVFLESKTSNKQSGDSSWRRADVTVTIPTACLLDETNLMLNVSKGDILVRDTMSASFKLMDMYNIKGDLDVEAAQAFRMNLNTSTGYMKANNVSAHYLYLIGTGEGSTLKSTNVTLYSGDNSTSCQNVTTYAAGYPEIPKYATTTVVCDQEPGVATIDVKGSEGKIIDMDGHSGGVTTHKIKVGDTYLRVMACIKFSGTFKIKTDFGVARVGMEKSEEQIAMDARSLFGLDLTLFPDYFFYLGRDPEGFRVWEVCDSALSGKQLMLADFVSQNQTFELKSNGSSTYGNMYVTFVPPTVE